MTKKILTALAATLALTLVGCAAPSTQQAAAVVPAPTVTVTTSAPEPEADSADERFEAMVPDISGETPTDAEWYELKRLGKNTCEAISNGAGRDDIIQLMLDSGVKPESRTGYLAMAAMVVASETYCPEHSGFFRS